MLLPHTTWIVVLLNSASTSWFRSFLLNNINNSTECVVKASYTTCTCVSPIQGSRLRFSIIDKQMWIINLIQAHLDAYDHTKLNAPVPVRSPKLSSVGSNQYLDSWEHPVLQRNGIFPGSYAPLTYY